MLSSPPNHSSSFIHLQKAKQSALKLRTEGDFWARPINAKSQHTQEMALKREVVVEKHTSEGRNTVPYHTSIGSQSSDDR